MTVIAEATGKDGELRGLEGTVVLVSDLAVTEEVKGFDQVLAFRQRWAEDVGDLYLGEGSTNKLQAAIARDSRIQQVIEAALEKSVEGVPLKKTDYVVWVQPGQTYDPSRVRPEKERKKKKIGLLVRKALRKSKKKTDDASGQQTLFVITTTLSDFDNGPLDPALFEPSAPCKDG